MIIRIMIFNKNSFILNKFQNIGFCHSSLPYDAIHIKSYTKQRANFFSSYLTCNKALANPIQQSIHSKNFSHMFSTSFALKTKFCCQQFHFFNLRNQFLTKQKSLLIEQKFYFSSSLHQHLFLRRCSANTNNPISTSLTNKVSNNKSFDRAFQKSRSNNEQGSTTDKTINKMIMKQTLKSSKRSNYKRKKRERVIALIPTKTNTMIPSIPLPKEIIDYKNIILLRNGITAEGKIFPRRFTKLNAKQQRYMSKAIKNARMVGLLPFVKKFK